MNRGITIYAKYLLCLVFVIKLAPSNFLFGQNNRPASLSASFVRDTVWHKQGELSFNVIRLYNHSAQPVTVQPVLQVPEAWTVIKPNFQSTTIKPGDSLLLPIRINIPSNYSAEKENQVFFQAFSQQNEVLAHCTFILELTAVHRWNITMPEGRLVILPNKTYVSFEIHLSNTGNVKETIELNLQTDRKLVFSKQAGEKIKQQLVLLPQRDTVLKYQVHYKNEKNRAFDISRIQVNASSSQTNLNRSITVERYTDSYMPFMIEQGLLHSAEIGVRTFSKNKDFLPYIKARGSTVFANEGSFKYNLTYYHLTAQENIISNSYYSFLYTKEDFQVGLGAYNSMLGRNLYSRNAVMISNKLQLGPESQLEGFASYGMVDNKVNAALGYGFQLLEQPMKLSAAHSRDDSQKRNTSSFLFNTNKISLGTNHGMSARLYYYHEENYKSKGYTLGGYAWDLNYFARLFDKVDLQLLNNYGSPGIPGPQMGLFNLAVRATYLLGETNNNAFSSSFVTSRRKYHFYNYEGIRSPQIFLQNRYGNVFFNHTISSDFRFAIGPSIEYYFASKPQAENNLREEYSIRKYRLELKAFIKRSLTLNIKYGHADAYTFLPVETKQPSNDIHILADFKSNGYGIKIAYDYGAMAHHGLYQFVEGSSIDAISLSPYMMQTFLNDRLRLNMFSNLAYRFDLQYGTININPRIEWFIKNNWYAVASGSYSFSYQQYLASSFGRSFYYLEFAVKKNWGKSEDQKWTNELSRLRIQLFKDDDGDGIKDRLEQGVANVKVRIRLTNSPNMHQYQGVPVDITLVTNDKGIVTFNRLPKGFYDLSIIPLESMSEYFYVDQNVQKIELLNNTSIQIPFQKANRLEGRIELNRQKFIKDSEAIIQLANIKVTAYNKEGNSFSTFTNNEGRFVIFVPGTQNYQVRLNNVFGSGFIIRNNDLTVSMPEMAGIPIVFDVAENHRPINFRRVESPPQSPNLQKIKVLAGTISQSDKEILDETTEEPKPLPQEYFYIVLSVTNSLHEAMSRRTAYTNRGLVVNFEFDEIKQQFYVYTNRYTSRNEAAKEVKILQDAGIRNINVIKLVK